MTHIVLENCIKCKFTDCVSVCPVDCFYEGKNFLVINTEDCIDCAVCVPECPINAIKNYNENLINHNLFYKINSNFSKIWPNIIKNIKNTENNSKWNNIKNKLHLIKL